MRKLIVILLLVILACGKATVDNSLIMESPLSSVVKLISAESLGNIDEAKKYINIERVYSKHINDTLNAESLWREQVKFKSTENNSSKFTNQFKYYNYEISETISSPMKAKVSFIPFNKDSSTKEINYSLEKENDVWKVIDIEYIK